MRHRFNMRAGFALLGVLWIIVGLSVLALTVGRVSRGAVAAAARAHDQVAGRWLAEGCLARLRSVANGVLAKDPPNAGMIWRNFDRVIMLDSATAMVGCELSLHPAGRIVLNRASAAALDSLPGFTLEAIAHVLSMQQAGTPITDLLMVESALSPSAKAIFDAHYVELLSKTTVEPDAWLVRAQAHVGDPPTPVNIEVRFVRAGSRAAVTRWVEW